MAYTLIHRTGTGRGRVYNGVGNNITADPAGAGNVMVGPWARDYWSLMDDGVLPPVQWDWEFSGIIMDGRQLANSGTNDEDMIYPDLDEDEDLSDRGSIIKKDTKTARCNSVMVRLYHTAPTWEDAHVWHISDAGAVETEYGALDGFLQDMGLLEQWHPVRHALRVPVYWALYKLPVGPNYEGLTEMIVENSATVLTQGGLISYGPLGMLTALHGGIYALQHAIRLYEPNISLVCVERGMFDMAYDSAHDLAENDPDILDGTESEASLWENEPPLGLDQTEVLDWNTTLPITNQLVLDTPAQRARGRIYTTVLRTSRDVRARPNEVYVWHFATAPVRIHRGTPMGGAPGSYVIGNASSPLQGPYLHLVYHECTARFSAR